MNSSNLLNRKKTIEQELISLQNSLNHMPEGSIYYEHVGSSYRWFHTHDGKHDYIKKRNREFAEQLALKKYLLAKIKDLKNESQAITKYLNCRPSEISESEQLLSDPVYQQLLSSHFKSFSQEISEWVQAPYPHNTAYPENLIHKSISGNLLRSKSEAIIDMLLYQNKIPYRYECALQLGAKIIYPDFTIRHPQTGAIYYWEHYGMMDVPYYTRKYLEKTELYLTYEIIPAINLITTFETRSHPFTIEQASQVIETHFM